MKLDKFNNLVFSVLLSVTLLIGSGPAGRAAGAGPDTISASLEKRLLSGGRVKAAGLTDRAPKGIILQEFDGPAAPDAVLSCSSAVRIMPLGDSITTGSASGVVPDDAAHWISYRKDLWDRLKADGYDIDFVGSQVNGDAYAGFDPHNEGHPGWRDEAIAANISSWLSATPADIVLLHIGTNDMSDPPDTDSGDVSSILDQIKSFDPNIWVIVARIIQRVPSDPNTATYNSNVDTMLTNRINSGDKILKVNMETGAGIVYEIYYADTNPDGDMADDKHPYASGYAKMAAEWEEQLVLKLPWCARDDVQSIPEDSATQAFSVLDNDAGQNLSITDVDTQSVLGTVTSNGTTISYTPPKDFFGTETIPYTISSGGPAGSDDSAMVTVTVTPVNDPPTAEPDNFSVLEDSNSTTLDVIGNDTTAPDTGETLTVTGVSPGSAGGTITPNGSTIDYQPAPNFSGTETFTYTLNDGTPGSDDTAMVTVTVQPVNDAPSFTKGADQTVNEDSGAKTIINWAKNISAGPTDEIGQTLTFLVTNDNNSLFTAQPVVTPNGTLTYQPAENANGKASVTVRLKDNGGTTDGGVDTSPAQTFTITVKPVNDAPVVNNPGDQYYQVGEDVEFQIQASDPDGDKLSFSADGLPDELEIFSDGWIRGTLIDGSSPSYPVTVTVTDGVEKVEVHFKFDLDNQVYLPLLINRVVFGSLN